MRRGLRTVIGALALQAALLLAASPTPAAAKPHPARKAAAPIQVTAAAAQMADWVRGSADNRGLPFAIIDKVAAKVFVFDADGQLKGAAPVLLGSAPGDDTAPGVGGEDLSSVRPEERTTPAGRFFVGYAPAKGGKNVLWVDYAAGISLHRVVTSNPKERRLQRLKSATPDDNRISYGCINVSAVFYDKVVKPTFTENGVVYILPEAKPLTEVFPTFVAQSAAGAAAADHAEAGPADGTAGGAEAHSR